MNPYFQLALFLLHHHKVHEARELLSGGMGYSEYVRWLFWAVRHGFLNLKL